MQPNDISEDINPKIDSDNVLPYSLEAEQCLLGALLLDNKGWDKIVGTISEQDFYFPEHQQIFRSMLAAISSNSAFDIITISQELDNLKELKKVGGIGYLGEMARGVPNAANIRSYAEIVRENALVRELIVTCNEISDASWQRGERSSKELLDEAERRIFKIAEDRVKQGGPANVNELLSKAVAKLDELVSNDAAITGLTTGFKELDEMTFGLQKADLVIVAGRPSMGKTSFAMNLVESVLLKEQLPVLVFSLEMPSESLMLRTFASLGRINQSDIRSGKIDAQNWPRITSTVQQLKNTSLYIDDTAGLTTLELRARARRVAREQKGKGIGMIMVDYLQLMQGGVNSTENRAMEISEISRTLKSIAKEFDCPVIALSQLNRSLEQRTDKRPVMSDLRESGAIEQDADLILFIYRDEVYKEDTQDKGLAEIIIAKQRNGPIGKLKLKFLGQYCRFEDLDFSSQGADYE